MRRALLGLSAAALLALWAAAPAGAVIGSSGGSQFGFEPRDSAAPAFNGNLSYHGGPVVHSNGTYAIYWDPPSPNTVTGTYDGDWKSLIDGFLANVGHDSGKLTNGFALTSQYTDASGAHAAYNSTFHGAFTDSHFYPLNGCNVGNACLTDAQVRSELQSFISANSLPTGMSNIYFVLTPPGVTICTDGGGTDCSDPNASTSFCSYHSFIGNQSTPGPSTILYAVQPWTAGTAGLDVAWDGSIGSLGIGCQDGGGQSPTGRTLQEEPNQPQGALDLDGDYDGGLADLIINEMSVEMANTVTNPLMNGWYDAGNSSEQSDECRDFFKPYHDAGQPLSGLTGADALENQTINGVPYYLNDQFNLDAMRLDYTGIICEPLARLDAAFTIPTAVQPGDVVGFDGTESLVDMGPATYSWDFGDGSSPVSGPSVYHAFATAGTYLITLTVTDQGKNVSSTQHAIQVGAAGTGGGTTGGGTTGGGTTGGGTTGGGTTTSGGGTTNTSGGAATTTSGGATTTSGGATSPTSSTGPTSADATDPVIAEQILSRSLATARRSGVTVNYRVDRAAAGRFDLILDVKTAARLHIKGAHVSAGASAGVVVGSAVFGTLGGGASKLSIHFTKSARSHLARTHSLPITVRFTVTSDTGRRSVLVRATTLR